MNVCNLVRGDSPLVIDVPHAGTHLPPEIAARLTPAARALPDTDWHVEKLYAFARDAGATLVVATHSRYVVDLNRDPSGAALYPGADNTELCPTRTFANEAIYADAGPPDAAEIAARRATYFEPYHAQLAAEVERVRARHGHVILLDGHSIRSVVPRFFAGRLADLNLGTADGGSCAPAVQAAADVVLAGGGSIHERRQWPFQGRLRDAPLRQAGARRPRAAARDRAGIVHGRSAAVPVGCNARRIARRRAATARCRTARGASRSLNMQRIFVAAHRIEAYLLVDRLAHAGIKAHVFNEHASSIVGEVPPDVAQPQVWLDDDDDRARADVVLRAYREERDRAGSIVCAKCGEENPATFELCWSCGWSLQ